MEIDYSKVPTEDLKALQSGDLSKVSTSTLQMLQKMDSKSGGTPPPSDSTTGFMRHVPQWAQDMVRGGREAVATAAPIAGAMAGGMVGAAAVPVTGPMAPVVGAGLGGAIGQQVSNIVDPNRHWRGAMPETAQAVTDVAIGATGEAGGQVLSKGVNKVGQMVAPWAKSLYRWALKVPSAKSSQLFPGAEKTAAESMVEEGIKHKVAPNTIGLHQARGISEGIEETIHDMYRSFTNHNPNVRVGAIDLSNQGTIGTVAKAGKSGETSAAKEAVEGIRQNVRGQGGMSGSFNVEELSALKQQYYNEVRDWEKSKPIFNVKGQFTNDAKKEVSLKAMEILEHLVPESQYWNKKWGAFIDLQKAIENTVHLFGNAGKPGIGAKVLATQNFGLAALDTALGIPAVKAKLAFWLAKGANWEAKNLMRAASQTGAKENEPQVIRYSSNGMRLTQ